MVPVMPVFAEITALAAVRFVPVKVTVRVPGGALAGLIDVNVGEPAFTVNGSSNLWAPTVRPKVVAPVAAVAAMVTLAVTDVAVALVIVPEIPELPAMTALAAARFVPAKVTIKVPGAALVGLSVVSVDVPADTVNGSDTV
jgi:hypothetical protein